jgi:hypothetical protein
MVLQGGPCGRVDRRRTQFNDKPHLLTQVGLIFFTNHGGKSFKSESKSRFFRYLTSMSENQSEQSKIDLAKVKVDITSVNELPIANHSTEFEKIHKQLQQALTNLDGV